MASPRSRCTSSYGAPRAFAADTAETSGELAHQSDHRARYTSVTFSQRLQAARILGSMGWRPSTTAAGAIRPWGWGSPDELKPARRNSPPCRSIFAPCVIRSPQRCMTGRVARPVGDFRDRIVVNPAIRSGKPVIRGTRITVSDVLEYLAAGMTQEQILADFPDITAEDIRAVLAFAAERERRLFSMP